MAQRAEVREGWNIVSKVGGIVPNINVIANLAPPLQVFQKLFGSCPYVAVGTGSIVALGKGVHKAATNGAKTHANVVTGHGFDGRCLGVVISQCVNNQVGVVFFQLLGNAVDKAEHQTGGAAFLGVNGCTLLAGAVPLVVVLRDGDDVDGGILFQDRAHVLQDCLIDLLAGKARVGVCSATRFAQCAKGVNEQASAIGPHAAVFAAQVGACHVDAVLNAPICLVCHAVPVGVAVFKIRGVREHIALKQNDIALGNDLKVLCKVANACILLQELVNAIEHAATVAAANGHRGFLTRKRDVNREGILIKRRVSIKDDGEGIGRDGNTLLGKVFGKLLACINFALAVSCDDLCAVENVIGRDVGTVGNVGAVTRRGGSHLRGGLGGCGCLGRRVVAARQKGGEQHCRDQEQKKRFLHKKSPI